MMNQTYKELIQIARAENAPYSRANKSTLISRIQQYRDTVGTLYRRSKRSLKDMAKSEGLRGYGRLRKPDLIDSILFHRSLVKPQVDMLSQLRKDELKRMARDEGLQIIGSRKGRIAENIARHRVHRKQKTMKDIVEDIANQEFKPQRIEGAFDGNYLRFRSEGVEEDRIVTIEEYLQKVRRHVSKQMKELVKTGESWKFQLNVVALFRRKDGSEETRKPIWSTPHVIMEGSDIEEIIAEMYQKILRDYERVSEALDASDFIFIRIVEMTYHTHKVDMVRGGSYIDLPE